MVVLDSCLRRNDSSGNDSAGMAFLIGLGQLAKEIKKYGEWRMRNGEW